ncbi:MAG: MFS transporter [Planctomycetia bacterium]|nr:MFS transporter [Planctomycetia bacterium]
MSPSTSTPTPNPIPRLYPWYMLIFLWGAFFLNQGDRQLFNNVLPLIEKPISEGGLGFDAIQLGLVAMIFTIFYGVFVPLAGFAGDVIQKRLVVFLSLMVFSLGTLATGMVPDSEWITAHLYGGVNLWLDAATFSLILLIIVRSVATGIGEAFYYPGSNSLIAQYHAHTRATAMAIHQTANYTGVVFGGTLAAWVGFTFGWRAAFYSFGLVGVLWALAIYFIFRNDQKDRVLLGESAVGDTGRVEKIPLGKALKAILSRPTFYLLSLAFGGMCFVNVGFLTWMPKYLISQFDVSGTVASFNATFYHHLLAYISVFIAAGISDYFSERIPKIRMYMEFIGLLLGTPFIYWMGASQNVVMVYVALAGFGLFRGVYDSNLFAAMFDVIEPQYRATATGLMLSFAFIIGSFSPLVLALFAKQLEGNFGPGLSYLSVAYFISALLVLVAILCFYNRDRAAAEKN